MLQFYEILCVFGYGVSLICFDKELFIVIDKTYTYIFLITFNQILISIQVLFYYLIIIFHNVISSKSYLIIRLTE